MFVQRDWVLIKAHMVLTIALLVLFIAPLQAAVHGEEVDYSDGETTLKGYLAYDAASKQQRPGILVVHEWWGHNDYARKRARMLAELGYVAFALDMYGEGRQAQHPEQASQMSQAIATNLPLARKRFDAALRRLKQQPQVDVQRIAAIGYCFGGGIVLQMAREGVDLDAVVSFHGSLATSRPAKKGAVRARILVAHGQDDPFTTADGLQAFRQEMAAAGADVDIRIYPGAKHAFTNPQADEFGRKFNLPLQYNEAADRGSWAAMKSLFEQVF